MTTQPTLSDFAQKTVSSSKSMSDFRPWNRIVLDWDIDYQGYQRDEEREGHVDFHVRVVLREASVPLRDPHTQKKREMPGYSLAIFQTVSFDGERRESLTVYEEPFRAHELPKAFDAFQQAVLTVQTWVEIAEWNGAISSNPGPILPLFPQDFCLKKR